ncbi:MAG: TraI domain-containing protein [Proteobacteria bacterium]|nr:TraI domain-containing protein [Pseudomonadota bacterium]
MFQGIQGIIQKAIQAKPIDPNMHLILPAESLLSHEKRQTQIQKFQLLLSLSDTDFDRLAHSLICQFAEFVQHLPETRHSYYAHKGGLLDHALDRTAIALPLCRNYFLPNEKDPTSNQLTKAQALWAYAVFSASLLHDVGRVLVDLKISLYSRNAEFVKHWNPCEGLMLSQGAFYKYDFEPNFPETFRRDVTKILARQLMPKDGFNWIASNKNVLMLWLAMLDDNTRTGSTLSPILPWADRQAIFQYIEKHMQDRPPKELKDSLGLKKDSSFLGYFSNPKTDTTDLALQDLAGVEFLRWVREGLGSEKLNLNKAPLGYTANGVIISADAFKLFSKENIQYKNWQAVQDSFMKLGIVAQETMQTFVNEAKQELKGVILPLEYALPSYQTAETLRASPILQEYFTKVSAAGASVPFQQQFIDGAGEVIASAKKIIDTPEPPKPIITPKVK